MDKPVNINLESPVHDYFGLSYAQFIVLSRTALQSMPIDWQRWFVRCVRKLEAEIPELFPEHPFYYHVTIRDSQTGRFVSLAKHDRLGSYDRGRTRVPLKSEVTL